MRTTRVRKVLLYVSIGLLLVFLYLLLPKKMTATNSDRSFEANVVTYDVGGWLSSVFTLSHNSPPAYIEFVDIKARRRTIIMRKHTDKPFVSFISSKYLYWFSDNKTLLYVYTDNDPYIIKWMLFKYNNKCKRMDIMSVGKEWIITQLQHDMNTSDDARINETQNIKEIMNSQPNY